MTFGESISVCFSKYADFNGRASRSEYWWFILFIFLCSAGINIIGEMVNGKTGSELLNGLFQLAVLLPSLAVSARRLHDTNRSGWWMLIALTVIGLIPLIIWYATQSYLENNEYGEIPIEL